MRILVTRFVRSDGTYDVDGIRIRCAPGNLEGSLQDEFERGIRTPVLEDNRDDILPDASNHPDLYEFVLSLPVARQVPVPDEDEDSEIPS